VPDAPAALATLSAAGVPNFRTPEAAADAIAAALRRRAPRQIPSWPGLSRPSTSSTQTPPQDVDARDKREHDELEGSLLNEIEAYEMLKRIGVPCAPSIAADANIAAAPSLPFPYPVVVKALIEGVAHKTEIGGVALGIQDADALLAAIGNIRKSVAQRAPGAKLNRMLVQPMIAGVGEALVGYRVDRDVGPLIMVAAGGILAELHRDRALRLAPVDLETAHEMIAAVRSFAALAGFRGRAKGDLDALAQAIVALSQLANDPTITDAEINPLIVRREGNGVVAVDALVRKHHR
jgi:acyl-CoA synthetase (NDP forming)